MRLLTWLTLCAAGPAFAQADECPDDPSKTAPGVCGCGQEDLDPDSDGIFDTCIHPTASVHGGATIGGGVSIGAHAVVGNSELADGVVVGTRARVEDGSYVGPDSVIGRRATVGSNTSLLGAVILSRAASVGANVNQASGSGTLVIGYASTIGARTSLPNNGTIGATVTVGTDAILEEWSVIARASTVGTGARVGASVIGPDVTIGPFAVIGDSVVVRKQAIIGEQARLSDGVRVGREVDIAYGANAGQNSVLRARASLCEWAALPAEAYLARGDSWCPPRTYPSWDPATASGGLTLSNGNLTATHGSGGWSNARATVGKSSGRWYWEVTANGDYHFTPGMIHGSQAMPLSQGTWTTFLPLAFVAYTFNSEGRFIRMNGANLPGLRLPFYTPGTPIGFAVDLDSQEVWMTYNGAWVDGLSPNDGDPGLFSLPSGGTWYPTTDGERGITDTVNFGATPFVGTVPTGFAPGWF